MASPKDGGFSPCQLHLPFMLLAEADLDNLPDNRIFGKWLRAEDGAGRPYPTDDRFGLAAACTLLS